MVDRVALVGDLWSDMRKRRRSLSKAIDMLAPTRGARDSMSR
jgi:hypothetical protein